MRTAKREKNEKFKILLLLPLLLLLLLLIISVGWEDHLFFFLSLAIKPSNYFLLSSSLIFFTAMPMKEMLTPDVGDVAPLLTSNTSRQDTTQVWKLGILHYIIQRLELTGLYRNNKNKN